MPRNRLIAVAFYSFTTAQLISILGDRLHQFSVVGMIGKVDPGSSVELFQLSVFMFLPVLLFAPVFGALVDRVNKAALLVGVDVLRAAIVVVIPTAYHLTGSLYAFYVPVLLLALANLVFLPAKSAIIPEAFGTNRLIQINSLLWGVGIVGTLAGFLLGGWLIDFHSWESSFYADAASYLLSVFCLIPLLFLPGVKRAAAARTEHEHAVRWSDGITGIGRAIRAGFRIIGDDRRIAFCLIVQSSIFGVMGTMYVAGVARLQEVLPPDKTIYLALVASTLTGGLLIGAGISHLAKGRLGPARVISFAALLMSVAVMGTAGAVSLVPMLLWSLLLGVAVSPPLILTETLLQVHTPDVLRGRVFSSREALTKTAFLATSTLGAIAAVAIEKTIVLTALGVLLAVAGVLLMRYNFLDA